MKVYISSSWKQRERVRNLAIRLREDGHEVYDFTDPKCRKTPEIPPEKFPEPFDPSKHFYPVYISREEWVNAVVENREAIFRCDVVVLLLPCGNDAHADWAFGVGIGKLSIVAGHPNPGDRSPVHNWATAIVSIDEAVPVWLRRWE